MRGGLGSEGKHEAELRNLVREETRVARKGEGRRSVLKAPDGGQAFKAAAAALQKPLLPGVRHAQKLFTPTAKLPASTCQTETKKRTLTKKIAKKSGRDCIMAAGDNCTEGLLGNIKTRLRTGVFRVQAYANRTQWQLHFSV